MKRMCTACRENRVDEVFNIAPAMASVRVPEHVHPDGVMWVCEEHLAMCGSYLTMIDEFVDEFGIAPFS